ncbi:MAG TPA: hypothetical protein PL093_01710 [Candidatus Pacearchaeota archaeon]|jgi:hypothetical protein|nr:hypothetical protein [Candidatus Pacearchaeota archaeon]HRR94934.1 hypothetical protein [Candidatus Paceibacterota bacterium]HQG09401.1 hypothetical protein [Candidatus Pacearchaeota archaeon]HQH20276.1 hypothetical protein [Candidatus Pacearchaeota archaeon]HQK58502.1 hypothetical protein [Candidatus Pacearchaeota archaeon]
MAEITKKDDNISSENSFYEHKLYEEAPRIVENYEKISCPVAISSKHAQTIHQLIKENEQIVGLNFWFTLLAHSQNYAEVLGLKLKDLEVLYEHEKRLNQKEERGFYSFIVDNLQFSLIAGYDIGANYEHLKKYEGNFYLNGHYIIMAYCETNPEINIDNLEPPPWCKAILDTFGYQQNDDEDIELTSFPWANIVPEEWHIKILRELRN